MKEYIGFLRSYCLQLKRKKRNRSLSNGRRTLGFVRPLALEELEARRLLATFEVNDVGDGPIVTTDETITLREAIEAANTTPGADTITFDPTVFNTYKTIQLSEIAVGEDFFSPYFYRGPSSLHITESLQIIGPEDSSGKNYVTLDASGVEEVVAYAGEETEESGFGARVILVQANDSDLDVLIKNITISGGGFTPLESSIGEYQDASGGGILLYKANIGMHLTTLTLDGSLVTGNESRHNGGGIAVFADTGGSSTQIRIIKSEISENTSAARGGGLHYYGSGVSASNEDQQLAAGAKAIFIEDSLFADNTAEDGGGMAAAVFTDGRANLLEVVNSTFSGNRALTSGGAMDLRGESIAFNFELSRLTNITVTNNVAGSYAGGILFGTTEGFELVNSIVAENYDAIGNPSDLAGEVSALHSLVGYVVTGSGTLEDWETNLAEAQSGDSSGNIVGGATGGAIDPGLTPLRDFDGPTRTHALLHGSRAIDSGDDSLDVKIAAAEITMLGEIVVTATTDLLYDQRGTSYARDANGDIATGSFVDMGAFEHQRPPIAVTNRNNSGSGSLRAALATANQSSHLGWDHIYFTSSVTTGDIDLSAQLLVDSSVHIDGPTAATVRLDGQDATRVIQINNVGFVELDNLTIKDGKSTSAGGINMLGDARFRDLLVTGGETTSTFSTGGGGIRNTGQLVLERVEVSGNKSPFGAGIQQAGGTLEIYDSEIINNDALEISGGPFGGGIGGFGGGIHVSGGTLTVADSTIDGNEASTTAGGGIYLYSGGDVEIRSSTISRNDGSGVFVFGGYAGSQRYINSTISSNDWQGVYTYGAGGVEFLNSTIAANDKPGLIVGSSGDAPLLRNTIVAGNDHLASSPDDVEGLLESTSANNIIGFDPDANSGISDNRNGTGSGPKNLVGSSVEDIASDVFVLDTSGLPKLANNGGPTQTHAIKATGPAKDFVQSDFVFDPEVYFDQRGKGFDRISGPRVDAGAYELFQASGSGAIVLAGIDVDGALNEHSSDAVFAAMQSRVDDEEFGIIDRPRSYRLSHSGLQVTRQTDNVLIQKGASLIAILRKDVDSDDRNFKPLERRSSHDSLFEDFERLLTLTCRIGVGAT